MSFLNFTAWPLNEHTNDGVNLVVGPRDMYTEVNNDIQQKQIFRFGGLFSDDCRFGCGDMPSKLAANGHKKNVSGKDVLDTFTSGLKFWSSSQQARAEREAAEKAAEIARLQLQSERQKTEQLGIMAKYRVPLAIGAAVLIGGVVAYFVYKSKK